ncbi:MAG TPA: hotdog domain-containing protein, partial [Acidimicrobiales bacterium]|nr:hotdog domain-containing protein [Acidimicrobiales bacterium]
MPSGPSEAAPPLDPGLAAGLCARVSLTVGEPDTAASLGSGDVPVLGTPRLVALCEEASCRALDGHLGRGRTSVASRIRFDHLAPVPVGAVVVAEATLERVEGRRL